MFSHPLYTPKHLRHLDLSLARRHYNEYQYWIAKKLPYADGSLKWTKVELTSFRLRQFFGKSSPSLTLPSSSLLLATQIQNGLYILLFLKSLCVFIVEPVQSLP